MRIRDLRETGHWPTLLAAFLYFDVSFMAWASLGPLMTYVTAELGLPVERKFSLVAVPILAGAALRIPLGALADRAGAKRTGVVAQVLVIAALAWAWRHGLGSALEVQALGMALGLAGASFAVALPQASRWYPARAQGLVMGIAGAGNVGVVLDGLLVPVIAEAWGWRAALGALLLPLGVALAVYVTIARDAPAPPAGRGRARYGLLLRDPDTWWFMLFYAITFGGFVGLANALPLYFGVRYDASGVAAGVLGACVVAFGSLFRPIGGMLADRIGGIRSLLALFSVVGAAYAGVALLPAGPAAPGAAGWALGELPAVAWAALAVFSLGALALGMGNGAVFQLIPLRFRDEIGSMTGLVGAAGGLGGFVLARALGLSYGATGSFAGGLVAFSALSGVGLIGLLSVKARWRTTWGAAVAARV